MNKLFAALLFFCVVGASVLWWLMKTLPEDKNHPPAQILQQHAASAVSHDAENPIEESAAVQHKLSIDTIPSGAKVEVGGIYQGVTPLNVNLRKDPTDAIIVLDGYDVYRRPVPTLDQLEGAELNWKITLKEQSGAAAVASSSPTHTKPKPLVHAWLRGSVGPYFIQIKAAEESVGKDSIETELKAFREVLSFDKISGCLVNLGKKGKWFRIVAGPFGTRAKADAKRVEWSTKKPDVMQGFVTGRQSCI